MPILRVKEIRDMSPEERMEKLGDLRTELLRLKTMIRAGGTVENPARVKELRKAIARILTIENEQRLGLGKEKTEEEREK
jgi:large subunit ribosomal protein L29